MRNDFTEPWRTFFIKVRPLNNRSLLAVQDALTRRELASVGGVPGLTTVFCLPHDDGDVAYALGEVLAASRDRRGREIVAQFSKGAITLEQVHDKVGEIIAHTGASADDEPVDEFPEPLSEIAFHGLAGDIVRCISPHTEASEAALLVQTLTAFGNAIARNAYAVADAAQHYMNLFAVLVGESSKSRKGTSWQHVLRVFHRADQL